MKFRFTLIAVILLSVSCNVLPPGIAINPGNLDLPDLGTAPELENDVWINADQPLRLADLRGKVVLLEMWTFG